MNTGAAGAIPDPGFRQSIFNSIYNGKVTPDNKYSIPDGTEVRKCFGTCSMTFGSSLISGTQSYQSKLEEKASVGFGGWGASFSASVDFKTVAKSTKNQSTFLTQSEVSCCAYTATILPHDPPSFSRNFLSSIDSLPPIYDKSLYREFIEDFGTHYI